MVSLVGRIAKATELSSSSDQLNGVSGYSSLARPLPSGGAGTEDRRQSSDLPELPLFPRASNWKTPRF